MAKMKAPDGVSSVSVLGIQYDTNESGIVTVPDESVASLVPLGFVQLPVEHLETEGEGDAQGDKTPAVSTQESQGAVMTGETTDETQTDETVTQKHAAIVESTEQGEIIAPVSSENAPTETAEPTVAENATVEPTEATEAQAGPAPAQEPAPEFTEAAQEPTESTAVEQPVGETEAPAQEAPESESVPEAAPVEQEAQAEPEAAKVEAAPAEDETAQ